MLSRCFGRLRKSDALAALRLVRGLTLLAPEDLLTETSKGAISVIGECCRASNPWTYASRICFALS